MWQTQKTEDIVFYLFITLLLYTIRFPELAREARKNYRKNEIRKFEVYYISFIPILGFPIDSQDDKLLFL